MKELLLVPSTSESIANYLNSPAQALLLAGQAGSGRLELSKFVATKLLERDELIEGASYKQVGPDDTGKMTINQIRELKSFVRLKSDGPRVVLVEDADKMQAPAQNSFLKLLEEPPEQTYLILTGSASGLKPTVLSRLQQITVKPVTREQALEYFGDNSEVNAAYDASGGRIGLMSELIGNSEHPLMRSIDDAKQVLRAGRYERLCQVELLSKDKPRASALVEMLGQMSSTVISSNPDETTLKSWLRIERASFQAEQALSRNSNTKLVLTDLMLKL